MTNGEGINRFTRQKTAKTSPLPDKRGTQPLSALERSRLAEQNNDPKINIQNRGALIRDLFNEFMHAPSLDHLQTTERLIDDMAESWEKISEREVARAKRVQKGTTEGEQTEEAGVTPSINEGLDELIAKLNTKSQDELGVFKQRKLEKREDEKSVQLDAELEELEKELEEIFQTAFTQILNRDWSTIPREDRTVIYNDFFLSLDALKKLGAHAVAKFMQEQSRLLHHPRKK